MNIEGVPNEEVMTFLRYEKNEIDETVAVFKTIPGDDDTKGEIGLSFSTCVKRLKNLQDENAPYDQTKIAVENWPKN